MAIKEKVDIEISDKRKASIGNTVLVFLCALYVFC